jgi:type II secretion system protein N
MKFYFATNKRWIAYTIYGIILTLALMFYRFPSDALKDYVQKSIHKNNPNLSVTFEKVSLTFPFSLKLSGMECFTAGEPGIPVFETREILVKPKILSLFTKTPACRFTCQAYDGTITGSMSLSKNGEKTGFKSTAELKKININDNSPLPAFIKDYIGGILEGTVSYNAGGGNDNIGNGEASLTVSKGSVKLDPPVLNIKAIDFKEVTFKADLKDQTLSIPDLNLKGDDFLGKASGAITFKNPVNKSLIGFKASMEPTASSVRTSTGGNDATALIRQSLKNGKLSFSLQGTIEKPILRMQ